MMALCKGSLSVVMGAVRVAAPGAGTLPRGFAKKKTDNSLEGMKEAAQRTGSAAKEWLTGASRHARSGEEKMKQSAEGTYQSAKRATQDITNSAKGAMASNRASPQLKSKASKAALAAKDKVEEISSKAKQAVAGEPHIASARAVWEEGREESQKQQERSSRKSRLTDEAHGDNPMEASTREEKQITDTDFYTRK